MRIENNSWRRVKLKEAIIIDKKSCSPININDDDIYIGLEDIDKETGVINTLKCAKEFDIKSNKFLFTSEHILYGKLRPNLNKVAIPDFSGICSTDIYPILTKEGIAVKRYIYHILHGQTFVKYASSRTNGANLPRVNEKIITEYEIPLPSLEIQLQIAKTLDTTAELLALRKQHLAELDNLIKSTFYDMFGDPAANENGWEIKTIAEVAEQKLSYGSGASAIEYDGTTRYIRITDINDNGSLNDHIVSPSEISEKYNLNDGDILFARSGATVGKTLRYRNNLGKCIYAGYLIKLIPNKFLVLPDYVYYFSKTDYYKGFIESNMKTVAQPNINAQQYGELKICVPPLSLQTNFTSIVTKIEEQKALVKKAIDETQYLFNCLMSEYFE